MRIADDVSGIKRGLDRLEGKGGGESFDADGTRNGDAAVERFRRDIDAAYARFCDSVGSLSEQKRYEAMDTATEYLGDVSLMMSDDFPMPEGYSQKFFGFTNYVTVEDAPVLRNGGLLTDALRESSKSILDSMREIVIAFEEPKAEWKRIDDARTRMFTQYTDATRDALMYGRTPTLSIGVDPSSKKSEAVLYKVGAAQPLAFGDISRATCDCIGCKIAERILSTGEFEISQVQRAHDMGSLSYQATGPNSMIVTFFRAGDVPFRRRGDNVWRVDNSAPITLGYLQSRSRYDYEVIQGAIQRGEAYIVDETSTSYMARLSLRFNCDPNAVYSFRASMPVANEWTLEGVIRT
jgi:hypothetical protein